MAGCFNRSDPLEPLLNSVICVQDPTKAEELSHPNRGVHGRDTQTNNP